MTTMYERLQAHLTKHAYTRGKNKGDAPMDAHRRGRSFERVAKRADCMAVHFHRTDVIRAYPDGRIVIDCDGWNTSPTTRACINDALRWFSNTSAVLCSERRFGKSQSVLYSGSSTPRVPYAYYDGIALAADGKVVSELRKFEGRRINRDATKEMYADMQECGFRDVFKLLHAVAEPPSPGDDPLRTAVRYARAAELRDFITNEFHANKWPYVVETVSFQYRYLWMQQRDTYTKYDYATAWDLLMRRVKQDLYDTVKIEEDTTESTK